jgi:asparagine synthase (glutamine-hydrolysing)
VGITGIVAPGANQYREILSSMTDSLRHRGPDASGLLMFANCGFGHRRLSIVDLATGHQPMLDISGRLAITFTERSMVIKQFATD